MAAVILIFLLCLKAAVFRVSRAFIGLMKALMHLWPICVTFQGFDTFVVSNYICGFNNWGRCGLMKTVTQTWQTDNTSM